MIYEGTDSTNWQKNNGQSPLLYGSELASPLTDIHGDQKTKKLVGTEPGGHYHWKVVRGCAAVMTTYFQASWRSLAYQFTIKALLVCP